MPARKAPRLAALVMTVALLGSPLAGVAQTPDASCSLLSRSGGRFSQTPLAGFDPATSTQLPAAPAGADSALVLCHRATIVPQVMDYRIPAEAHLPLAITDERATVMLDIADGRLQLNVRKGRASPEEEAELKTRLDEMQSAMTSHRPPG